ncbi:DEAD/DEAH box helicase [Hyphomicrobium sp.]|uniref:DEAD/DEAH box helicase n=1 Tax=Hyphomicrobium sp. TaxID=82 RepID=UPI002E354FB2|nr:DEAD/DEAH box helicase [Hyphomicrobium sp.]HEX2841703.1 DEAD/DEAH box helicase [Hyphomicrobium sp.]
MTFPSSHPALARTLAARGYENPTPVQLAVLQADAVGRDLLVSAQTGSGKTVAFGLAMASTLLGAEERLPNAAQPLALIIAPTRELALQVQRELIWLYSETGARLVTCVGGMDPRAEARQLGYGAHIIVGTPGRLRDHLERGRLDFSNLKAVVLDEADEMLDLGFREDLEFILDATPESRQTLLFSATMPREIEALARRYQRDAVRVETLRRNEQHADIEYRAMRVAPSDIEHAVVNILRFEEARAAIVFCSTREAVKRLHARLAERGFSAVSLSGELTQNERSHALQALRDGRARVLVATDVAARGLDLPDLALVIHADLPHDAETLLHRSGRTGRAGKKGLCAIIVPFNRRRKAESLLTGAKLKVTWGTAPAAEQIRARDQERFLADAMFTDAASDEDLALAQTLQGAKTADEIALALVRIHRASLPAPEDLAEDKGPPPRRDDRPSRHSGDRFERRSERPRFERNGSNDADVAAPRERRERPLRDHGREMVWFRVNIGRERNADPRWLLPLLCKAGNVTKSEIGAIKIFDRDTRFQIAAEVADKFADHARSMKPNEGRISRVRDHAPEDFSVVSKSIDTLAPSREERAPNDRPAHRAPKADAPRHDRSRHDGPRHERPKKTWRDQSDSGAGNRPHRKSEGKDSTGGHFSHKREGSRTHGAGGKPHKAGHGAPGASRPTSKYAHKKKHRGNQPEKT